MKFESKLNEETILFSELTVKDYKELLKCILGDAPNPNVFLETVSEIFSNVTKKPISYFKELSAIDFLLFLIDLRIYTGGQTCSVTVKRNGKEAKLNLNLTMLQRDLLKTFNPFHSIISYNSFNIKFQCPSVKRLIENVEANEEYLCFIKSASVLDQNPFLIETNKQASLLFDKLTPKLSIQIIEKYKEFAKTCLNTNFLSRYKVTESVLGFMPNIDSIIWFARLFFNEPLDVFYNNLFYLSYYGHMNLAHIEQCTVGEYIYYVNMLRSVQTQSSSQQPNNLEESLVDSNMTTG